ncbi:GPI ethanolamine phosphate transferase 2 isoform X2 [Salvia miltiorrhiza]|uniref:GPI ethanolamine phosphate transferase 2 isoform X2 n=1 Tax=Salvia miltiorrhiza TaxID=226208 RepID=UPI0025ACD04E|nr:GPI ethanolamine phosphate transferase 2 isoform X2 [Salvia miltiorrhiza]
MPARMGSDYSLTCKRLTLFTVSAVVIQMIGLYLFIVGFFPVKPSLSGMSGLESFYPPGVDSIHLDNNISTLPPEKLKSLYQELSGVPPLYDRLILMVIDGLPAEFLLGKDGEPPPKVFMEAMPYTQSLLASGLAIGFHAKAAPPTVTMPRLKAMVSGAIGGFLDVASNFNTQAFLEDNLIAQFRRIGWKMTMLGDETWLKLFPNMFNRHDGVSSFFVKDTIEVDYNVSRHLTNELCCTDWDLLILHYLGLDHVGHIGGRNSVLMCPKLTEMDKVIERIHSSITLTQEMNQRGTLLVVVSDHGMTDGGNHGGSSYEETDSLALFISAEKITDAENSKEAYQVDIASTLALLFGVPIPKNNVGTVMTDVFSSLKAEQQLRILELNSWQLLRLLQTHFAEFECERFLCESANGKNDGAERFCCSYLAANKLHESWKSKNSVRSINGDDYGSIVMAYHDFLGIAGKWLSSRSTDKPFVLLALGIAAMLLSCLVFMSLLFLLGRENNFKGSEYVSCIDDKTHTWHLEEKFIVAVMFILVLSMASSSMVEEEQYIWHFMTSSFYLILLRKAIQSITNGSALTLTSGQKVRIIHSIYCIIAVLLCRRILRGWHQGGVNWSYLPDISKLLAQAGTVPMKSLHLLSLVLVSVTCSAVLLAMRLRTKLVLFLLLIYCVPVLIILEQILKYQDGTFTSSSIQSTAMIQIFYALIGINTVGILVAFPWLMLIRDPKTARDISKLSDDALQESQCELQFGGIRESIYVIGWCFVFSWSLLQLLLQQPINSMPTYLLLVQILATLRYFSEGGIHLKHWVKVAALYYLGMAGHFGLGNTNTLATIDVAGAFIGMSSHSTVISGILMFIITYASPMLALLSTLMDVSVVDTRALANSRDVCFGHLLKTTLGNPCLVPLGLNSIVLLAYTIILLLMRNHLFVWSVFSPKYLYVCGTTACVYIGVLIMALTVTYACIVRTFRVA